MIHENDYLWARDALAPFGIWIVFSKAECLVDLCSLLDSAWSTAMLIDLWIQLCRQLIIAVCSGEKMLAA